MVKWSQSELNKYNSKRKPSKGISNAYRNVPKGRKEQHDHKSLCDYMKLRYKGCLWRSDMSGLPLAKSVAATYWRDFAEYRSMPDWCCYVHFKDLFVGLQIEIKVHGFDLMGVLNGKAGSKEMQQHHQEQLEMIYKFRDLAWCAGFCVGYDNCKGLLDAYMNGDLEDINRFIYPRIKPIY